MSKFKRSKRSKQDFILPGAGLSGVKVPPGGLEPALRMFKKQIKEAGIIDDLKARKEFIKPSMKHRLKMKDARRWNSFNPPQPEQGKNGRTLLIHVPLKEKESRDS